MARTFTRYPTISLAAEHFAMAHLLRRNILTYKAPPYNEGYDLICIHPDPRRSSTQIRVQVKSRMASDSDRGFPVKSASLDAFDYLIVVFLNVGYFFRRRKAHGCEAGQAAPQFYTLPASFIRRHHDSTSTWEKVRTRGLNMEPYEGTRGIEQIARTLKIEYPRKAEARDRI